MGTANGALPKTYLTNKGPTMKNALSLFALIAAFPAVAEETRQLDAHEHATARRAWCPAVLRVAVLPQQMDLVALILAGPLRSPI